MMLEPLVAALPLATQMLLRGGWVSVQTFFILSGLVLAHTYAHFTWNIANLKKYALARVARVYPGYLLSLLVVSPFIYYTLVHGTGKAWPATHKAYLLINYFLVLQGWTGSLNVGWNTPAWSLSCEFVFYLCFPLTIFALRKLQPPARILAPAALALALPTILAFLHAPDVWKPVHHLADFLMGIAAAGILNRLRPFHGAWLYVPASLLFAGIIANPKLVEWFCFLNSALRPVSALMLIGLAIGGGTIARALSTRTMNFLGQASYQMYILHIPLLWWFTRYGVAKYWGLSPAMAGFWFLSGVLLLSSLAFHFVEEPANQALRSLLRARPAA